MRIIKYIILATSNVFSRLTSNGKGHHQAAYCGTEEVQMPESLPPRQRVCIHFSQKKLKRKNFLTNFLVYMKENPYICASINKNYNNTLTQYESRLIYSMLR